MSLPSVTIAIPTFNGLSWLKDSIDSFIHQNYKGELAIAAMDSGSTDGTIEFLESRGVTVYPLTTKPFRHGKTRNELVQKIRTELVLFTVQDAKPTSSSWLNYMVESLIDSAADAMCGGQCVPKSPRTNPLQWFRPIDRTNRIETYSPEQYSVASAITRASYCRWDNVNAIYKTQTLQSIPFPDVDFGEDAGWAKAALEANNTIGYCSQGKVYHYHHENPDFVRNRVISTWYARWTTFGTQPPEPKKPHVLWWVKKTYILIFRLRILAPTKLIYWLFHNMRNSMARFYATKEVLQAISENNLESLYLSLKDKAASAPPKNQEC